jgi:hypothetical protein
MLMQTRLRQRRKATGRSPVPADTLL